MSDVARILKEARDQGRLTALDFAKEIFDDFIELHGDRNFRDDGAVIGGIGRLNGQAVTVVGIQKGKNLQDNLNRNFGQPHPEGYRKALRLMKQAEKFRRPVICFVDTSGAYCGIGAEERGQGQAIAENLMEMMTLKTPILTILIGEGGSGGALALAVADEVWMLENAIYSVISPEGCASILWKDSSKTAEASECLKITSQDLFSMGVIERIIREPKDLDSKLFDGLKHIIEQTVSKKLEQPIDVLLDNRYNRFRKFGKDSAAYLRNDE